MIVMMGVARLGVSKSINGLVFLEENNE
jgi:hypothetical protein